MAKILFKDGKIQFDDTGKILFTQAGDDPADCACCGGSCTASDTSCTHCDDNGGFPPLQYDVTFSLTAICACETIGGTDFSYEYINGFVLNTVHRLSQSSDCLWEKLYSVPLPLRETSYATSDGTCGTPNTPGDFQILIVLERSETEWTLEAFGRVGGSGAFGHLFYDVKSANTSGADQLCATLPGFSNDLATCGTAVTGSAAAWATGGSATVVCV